ncbi:hypothetical protein B0H14DRAFT_2621908 [Mycena olivaceomarginata]|nr:hypothetical protein B0H14DRAFT_2621908 [Mycena olivaceomarginata]
MDSLYLQDSLGNVLTPIWSKKESVLFCSVLAPLSSMASEILRYNNPAPLLLDPFTSETYHDREHWLGWVPTGEPPRSPYETEPALDLLEICFRQGPVPTTIKSVRSSGPAGCHLDPTWVEEVSYVDDRLHALSRSLAETSEFYCRGPPMNRVGDIPNPIDVGAINMLFANDGEAQEAAIKVKQGLLSLVGFLAWMLSLVQLKDTKLTAGDQQYLQQLRLSERPKTGAVFNLTRGQHEINFPHWANNGVPFHYAWMEEESKNRCFLRFSPEYYQEVARLREIGNIEDKTMKDLSSYAQWKDALDGSDWIGQNLRAGKMGIIETRFQPSMKYGIVDRHLYGARPLINWSTIRVYAERFKALIREGERETVCTFFRNNPIHQDEPAYGRPPLQHRFTLSDFAFEEAGVAVSEQSQYYESNSVMREQVKNLYAPRPDRPFNSFNRGPTLSLPGGMSGVRRGRSGGSTHTQETLARSTSSQSDRYPSRPLSARREPRRLSPEIHGTWARAVAGVRHRSSRSLSPLRCEEKGKGRQARSLSLIRTPEINKEDTLVPRRIPKRGGRRG